ncbi:MAG: hypothetical protein WDN06_15050 [Asticcacaulis sp.]
MVSSGPLVFSYRLDDGHGNYIDTGNFIDVVPHLGPNGDDTEVNTYTDGTQDGPATSYLEEGYVTVWASNDTDGHDGIYLQRFNDQGLPVGEETQVAAPDTETDLREPTVTLLAGGGFVVGWLVPPRYKRRRHGLPRGCPDFRRFRQRLRQCLDLILNGR